MEKNIRISILNDLYGAFLSAKQRDILRMYYDDDLSLAEIAENLSISRQGVRDFLIKSEKTLNEYEETLHLSEILDRIGRALEDESIAGAAREELTSIISIFKE